MSALRIDIVDGKPVLVGEAPELILIADELLTTGREHIWSCASNVKFLTDPPLRYVIVGRSVQHPEQRVWIAERVEEFEA